MLLKKLMPPDCHLHDWKSMGFNKHIMLALSIARWHNLNEICSSFLEKKTA